jgi:hypothetical protein
MDSVDVSLQGVAGLVFVSAGVFLGTKPLVGAGLVALAVAILVLKAVLIKNGINIQGKKK